MSSSVNSIKIFFHEKSIRIYLLILISTVVGACTLKPVETVYYEDKDLTRFTTKAFKSVKRSKEIELVAEKECAGKMICVDQDVKLTITHSDRFSFLKGKDLVMDTEQGQIDLNQRDYSNSYDMSTIAKDGTDGVLNEKFLIWVTESEFLKAAHAEKATINIGDYAFQLSSEGRDPWQVMMDKDRLLEVMEEEQQREYGKYPYQKKAKKELDLREKRMVSEAAESTWKLIQDSDNLEDFEYFLEQFPDSPYSVPAKLKLKLLQRKKSE